MFSYSFRRTAAIIATALLLAATLIAAQDQEPTLRITPRGSAEKQHQRNTSVAQLDRNAAFSRTSPTKPLAAQKKHRTVARADSAHVSWLLRTPGSVLPPTLLSFGTGGGDLNEVEPNDSLAQEVSLPVNIFGEISFSHDVDFFAFQAIAGQQITIEPFAARLQRSQLAADIALFDSSGQLLATDEGDENDDPVIRFTPLFNQVLLVGISDVDELGGQSFDYILNITRGHDVDEQEPNGRSAQGLPDLPVTVFGEIDGGDDVDFYSFTASAGQTLIVDVDAEVLGSRLDAEINVMDPATGVEFFYNDQNDGDDPRFNIVLPYPGRYVIGIGAFGSNSSGFYRLNASLVSSAGAPVLNSVTRLAKKLIEVSGAGFTNSSVVEVNGAVRATTVIDSQTLRAKVKAKVGSVVTVSNSTDDRRSNPLVVP